ncbi:hypothetical protein CAPTEDRAFT_220107 [Capitella teleta]|uniref:Synaptic plasticity regulator PANTS n=1 Tax=Capitella teleta TaxID=283909 RepID=R7TH32_CAPTE|nr:hypothetical protein CAPTEDRAFT_220107 [Capitella teleta]|eukprot:ELT90876.1 hypothetical protein CAPTEDRAFT_220107 [Capitella teleta]
MEKQTPQEDDEIHPDFWMYRPCGVYLDEFVECTSWKARYHQRYVDGKEADCSKWKKDHENCIAFRDKKSYEALESLLASEKERRAKRLEGAKGNTVWEYRTSPPENWAAPLPPHLQKIPINLQPGSSSCVIS